MSQLKSQYIHSAFATAAAVAKAAATAVAADVYPAAVVQLIASIEEVLAAMWTHSHSH